MSAAPESLAARLFAAQGAFVSVEEELHAAVDAVLGIDLCEWPGGGEDADILFDHYDGSVELKGLRPDAQLTDVQLAKLLDLGFARGWLCYEDATEISFSRDAATGALRKSDRHASPGGRAR